MSAALVCGWCGRLFDRPNRRGPTPVYCKQSCRQRAYETRRLEAAITAALAAR